MKGALVVIMTIAAACTPLIGGDNWSPDPQGGSAPTYKLVVIAGQSNALGPTATAGNLSGVTYPDDMPFAYKLSGVTDPPLWGESWYDEDGGLLRLNVKYDTSTCIGVEFTLGQRLEEVNPGQWRIAKLAVSSSGLEHWYPNSPYPASEVATLGNLLEQFVDYLTAAEAATDSQLKFMVWIQGEADASVEVQANQYVARMLLIRDYLWNNGFPAIRIVMGRLNDDFSGAYMSTVRAAMETLASDYPGFLLVDLDPYALQGDNIHYTVASILAMGPDFANAYFTYTGEI